MTLETVLKPELLERAGIDLQCGEYEILKGGNNRVFKVSDSSRTVVIKQYFDDGRQRLEREAGFVSLVWNSRIRTVPEPLLIAPEHRAAVYAFIDGEKLPQKGIRSGHMSQILDFIREINRDGIRFSSDGKKLLNAAEACFSFEDHFSSVDRRMQRFMTADSADPADRPGIEFMIREVGPVWEELKKKVTGRRSVKKQKGTRQCLISPSDFGFHNILARKRDRELVFIDFEYAGWDDPAKLICDFFCQVETPVPHDWFEPVVKAVKELVDADPDFESDLDVLMKVCRVKWCCIMLNVFLGSEKGRKKFAGYDADIRELQLEKTKNYAKKYLF